MDLRQLRYFVAIAEELHFGRAAARLGIEQSPLSRAIREFEGRLKLKLLVTSTRRTEVTPAGAMLLEAGRQILESVNQTEARIRRFADGTEGQLNIGVCGGMLSPNFPALIRQFRHESPSVEMNLREMSFEQQLQSLKNGTLDGGMTYRLADTPAVVSEPLAKHALLVALSSDHPLSRKDFLSLSEVSREPLVVSSSFRLGGAESQINTLLGPETALLDASASVSKLLTLVVSGLAVGLLTEAQRNWIAHPAILFRPLSNKRNFLPVYFLRRREAPSELLKRFIKTAKTTLQSSTDFSALRNAGSESKKALSICGTSVERSTDSMKAAE